MIPPGPQACCWPQVLRERETERDELGKLSEGRGQTKQMAVIPSTVKIIQTATKRSATSQKWGSPMAEHDVQKWGCSNSSLQPPSPGNSKYHHKGFRYKGKHRSTLLTVTGHPHLDGCAQIWSLRSPKKAWKPEEGQRDTEWWCRRAAPWKRNP